MTKYYNELHCPISYLADAIRFWAQFDDDTPANMAVQFHINVSLNGPAD